MFRLLRQLLVGERLEPDPPFCRAEDDEDTSGSTWFCTLPLGHLGAHETWVNGRLRYQWPRRAMIEDG